VSSVFTVVDLKFELLPLNLLVNLVNILADLPLSLFAILAGVCVVGHLLSRVEPWKVDLCVLVRDLNPGC